MDKKIGLGFLLIFICMIVFYFFIQSNNMNSDDNNYSNTNSNSNTSSEKIGNVNNVILYTTDYIYDDKINGYNYTEISLSKDQIDKLKSEISNIKLVNVSDTIIYGKYKLVLDNKVLFFDMGNDYALYNNKVISFKDSIKQILVSTTDTCSCCTTSNCLINMCHCN